MIKNIYDKHKEFYSNLEVDYSYLKFESYEWESLHLRYLIYYLVRYDIRSWEYFTAHHYRVSYKLYLENELV